MTSSSTTSLDKQASSSHFLPITEEIKKKWLYAAQRRDLTAITEIIDTFGPQIVFTSGKVEPSLSFLKASENSLSTEGNALVQAVVGDIFHWIDNDKRAESLPEIIDLLTKNGCDMNARLPNGQIALDELKKKKEKIAQKLLMAVLKEEEEKIEKYLKRIGPNVCLEEYNGESSIFNLVLAHGRKWIVRKFIDAGVDIHNIGASKRPDSYHSNLILRNDNEFLSWFFKQGYHPNDLFPDIIKMENDSRLKFSISEIFWHAFVFIGNIEAVKICLQHGANLSLPMCDGLSIFELLQKEKSPYLLEKLKKLKCDILSLLQQNYNHTEDSNVPKIVPYLMSLSEAYNVAESTNNPTLYQRALKDILTTIKEREPKEIYQTLSEQTSDNFIRNTLLPAAYGPMQLLNSLEKLLSNNSPEHQAILKLLEEHRDSRL